MQGCTGTIVPTRGGRKQISEGPFMSKLASISAVLGIAMPSAMISSPSLAEQMKFKADMSASQVVPHNDNAGKGTARITFDTASRTLSWTIEYSGLTAQLTAGHCNGPAGAGENGGVGGPVTRYRGPRKRKN